MDVWTLAQFSECQQMHKCWMAIRGNVYDVRRHDGTSYIVGTQSARSNVSLRLPNFCPSTLEERRYFSRIVERTLRPSTTLSTHLSSSKSILIVIKVMGRFEAEDQSIPNLQRQNAEIALIPTRKDLPSISEILSIGQMEDLALGTMSEKAVSYYHSGSDDEITKEENQRIYSMIFLRPRVFTDCSQCSTAVDIMGSPLNIPIYISPAAMAKLAHPGGEAGIAAACSTWKTLQIISKNASMSLSDIVKSGPDATFAWQLYVLKDIKATERILARVRSITQIKFIVLTLDAPFPGKRERDERHKMSEAAAGTPPKPWGTESALTWTKTLKWLRTQTELPIVLKGIQSYEDAYLATLFPSVKGIIVSNHGGRALDTTTTPIQTLLEIRKYCPEVFEKLDVMIDGGIKRGTDVVKALALGAKGVGIGRAALYGLAVGGESGVSRTLEILTEETKTAMRLLGASSVTQLNMRHVNTSRLTKFLFDGGPALREMRNIVDSKL